MATYTDNYQLTKPLYSEIVDVSVLNNNMDKVDDIMHNSQISLADAYDQTQTYELGEKVMYEMLLYRCVSRITTPEVWNPDHWERTTAADEGGNYVDVDEKFQTGLNVADVDIDGDQHYIKVPYMTGATSQADGAGGLVPAPEAGDEDKFLKGDGSWGEVSGDYVEYATKTSIIDAVSLSWENSTAGRLKSDGTTDGLTGYEVSDFISLENITTVYRYNVATQYNLEAYALYDSSKQMISGTYHARTTSYTKETYKGKSNVTFYDINNADAKYIRITRDKTLNYLFEKEVYFGENYTIFGNINAQNIEELEKKAQKTDSINYKKIENQNIVMFRSDRDTIYSNTYINPATGEIQTGSHLSAYITSDYISVLESTDYETALTYSVAYYNMNKVLLGGDYTFDQNRTGANRYGEFTTPQGCAYIRICASTTIAGMIEKISQYDVLNLGDSIFGVNPPCFDISTIAQEKTGYSLANCGFGGSQASSYPDSSSPFASFSFWKLCDAIYDEDFTNQISDANTIYNNDASSMYKQRMGKLVNLDFSKIKLITVAYGTNDFSKNIVIDNENDKYDKTTFCGALRYGIEKLISKYPNIIICLMSPPYRRLGSSNENSSDTTPNNINKYIMDYVNACKDVADEYHISFFNHYGNMGVNDYNWASYLRDGTHLSYIDGSNLFGAKVGEEINALMPEYV